MSNIENSLDVASAMSIRGWEASLKDISERSLEIAYLSHDDKGPYGIIRPAAD